MIIENFLNKFSIFYRKNLYKVVTFVDFDGQ